MLFDKEFEYRGKYATYCRFLKDEIGIFKTFREAYMISAILGFLNNTTNSVDNTEKVQPASILPSELSKQRKNLIFIYRLMMLLKTEDEFTIDDYKNRAFRDDSDDDTENLKINMKIFNSYAEGGIEYIYNKFKDCSETKEVVNELYDFLTEFISDVGI